MLLARALFSRFARTLGPVAEADPAAHAPTVRRLASLRQRLLAALGLPATRHNLDRLVLCALGGLSLTAFIRDVDDFFPAPTLADEALFLGGLAAHCARRGATSAKARSCTACSMLSSIWPIATPTSS